MYRKDSQEWLKHIDFILLDLICLQAAFLLAYAASGYGFSYDISVHNLVHIQQQIHLVLQNQYI